MSVELGGRLMAMVAWISGMYRLEMAGLSAWTRLTRAAHTGSALHRPEGGGVETDMTKAMPPGIVVQTCFTFAMINASDFLGRACLV